MIDFWIISATLIIACISSLMISLGNIDNVKREPFTIIVGRIIFFVYAGIAAASFIKFLEIYFNNNK